MKRKRKLKRNVKRIILFLILASFIIFVFWFKNKDNEKPSVDNSQQENIPPKEEKPPKEDEKEPIKPVEVTYLNKISNEEKLTTEQIELLTDFFDEYYKSMKELKEYDLTKYFVNPNSESALIMQTALSVLIENRKSKPNDLSLTNVKYDIDIKSVSSENETIKIKLLENTYMNFKFMSEIESKIYNIENNFTIKKVDNEYKIVEHDKVQDLYVMITDVYKGGGKTELDKIKQDYISIINKNVQQNKKDYDDFINGRVSYKTCDHEYNRDAALNYALSWVNKRNNKWHTFDSNCQNFVSQVLYTGGIIMDSKGSADSHLQWKFYDISYNTKEEEKGYVYTWTFVPYFYTYAKNNEGTGLCATVDANIYSAEPGDVIHVGPKAPTRHAVIVIGTYEKDGKLLDILVNSNTVDLENFPISAYAYPYASLIKVNGYND